MPPKKEFSSFSLVATLVLIATGAGLVLASVNELTRGRIERVRRGQLLKSMRQILPEGAIPVETPFEIQGAKAYPAYDASGNFAGAAIETSDSDAYSGVMTLLVGLDSSGKLNGFRKVVLDETPGLGVNILKDKFQGPLLGKGAGDLKWSLKKDGGDVDAVTAATISSRAAARILASSFETFENLDKGKRPQ